MSNNHVRHDLKLFRFVLWASFILSGLVVVIGPFTSCEADIRQASERAAEDRLVQMEGESSQQHEKHLLDRFRRDLVKDLSPVGQSPTVLVISAGFLAILNSLDRREKKGLLLRQVR